jgi:hypothetical protein
VRRIRRERWLAWKTEYLRERRERMGDLGVLVQDMIDRFGEDRALRALRAAHMRADRHRRPGRQPGPCLGWPCLHKEYGRKQRPTR